MPDPGPTQPSQWLAEEFARQLTQVLESMLGESPRVTFTPHELSPADVEAGENELLWREQQFSLGPDALLWVGATALSWEGIGNRILRGEGVDDGDPESIRST